MMEKQIQIAVVRVDMAIAAAFNYMKTAWVIILPLAVVLAVVSIVSMYRLRWRR